MALTELTIRIVLVFLPGIISKLIIEALTVHSEKRHFYFIVYSFILGNLCYANYFFILKAINWIPNVSIDTKLYYLSSLLEKNQTVQISEIIFASLLEIAWGIFFSNAINKKYLYRVMQRLTITTKFAEADVWSYLFNSQNEEMGWVRFRDPKTNLCYEGWVEAFSDKHQELELFIRDVTIYKNDTGEELYKSGGVYISRNANEVSIEFFALDNTSSQQ